MRPQARRQPPWKRLFYGAVLNVFQRPRRPLSCHLSESRPVKRTGRRRDAATAGYSSGKDALSHLVAPLCLPDSALIHFAQQENQCSESHVPGRATWVGLDWPASRARETSSHWEPPRAANHPSMRPVLAGCGRPPRRIAHIGLLTGEIRAQSLTPVGVA